ncbi:MAG: hypothetical protein WD770_04405 [Actinomycetota bacterium]
MAAGTSTFLTLLVASAILMSVGVLAGRLTSPATIPGGSTTTIALPALSDTVTPPPDGPGSIPPGTQIPEPGAGGEQRLPPNNRPPGENPPPGEEPPAVGASVGGDVGGLGLIEADIPIRLGDASGETTTTEVDVLGLHIELETSDTLVEDLVCLLFCQPD